MQPLRQSIPVLLCFCLAFLAVFDMQAKGEEDNIWIPFQLHINVQADEPVRTLSDGTELELGDPGLGKWAIDMINKADRLSEEDLLDWMRVVQLYRITEAEPVIMGAVSKLAVNHDEGLRLRRTAYFTATVIATKKSKTKLKKLIQAEIFANDSPENRAYQSWYKMQFCATLLTLGDSSGYGLLRNDLIKALVKNPDNFVQGYNKDILVIVKQMAQPGLLGTIEKALENPGNKDKEHLHETFGPIAKIMKVNAYPVSELRSTASTTIFHSEENVMLRNYAIAALGERGDLSDIEFLENLQPWDIDDEENEEDNERFETARNDALLILRCRMWRELLRQRRD